MKGDFTRFTFRPEKHYSSVRLQQGRVQLDADWNEQADIQAYLAQTTASDVIGRCGVPFAADGFQVAAIGRLNSIHMASEKQGWVVGDNGTILATSDAGKTWRRQATPAGVTIPLKGVHFVDARQGWIVGDKATLLATHDGGNTWTRQATPAGVTANLSGIHFVDARQGWVVGDNATLLVTGDGGLTWTAQATPSLPATNLHDIHFASATHGWAVGDNATLLFSEDGGKTWKPQTAPQNLSAPLHGVHFVDANQGWAVGDNATLLTTTNGGTTWTRHEPPPEFAGNLAGVHFTDAKRGRIVGNNGVILATSDGGTTWTQELRSDDFTISPGRLYVDGMLCENEQGANFLSQPDVLTPPSAPAAGSYLAYLDVWQRLITAQEDPTIREIALGGPDTAVRTKTVWQVKLESLPTSSSTTCGQFGSGWTPANSQSTLQLRAQAAPPQPSTSTCLVPPSGGFRRLENQLYRVEIQSGAGSFTSIDAVPGPNLVIAHDWTVDGREFQIGQAVEFSGQPATGNRVTTTATVTGVDKANRTLTLDKDTSALTSQSDIRLRRAAMFKWSRDNGTGLTGLSDLDAGKSQITVTDPGRDTVLGFADAAWVEVSDDARQLAGAPGVLFQLDSAQGTQLLATRWPDSVARNDFGQGASVRRWDGVGAIPAAGSDWLELEDGVQIQFTNGETRTGDYWLVPARSANGSVDWPQDSGTPLFRPRQGIRHHYCALALMQFDGTLWTTFSDCRKHFPALSALTRMFYVGGDGQEAMPGSPLPELLQVGVANGTVPVVGVTVRFSVTIGSGVLQSMLTTTTGSQMTTGASVLGSTSANGIATCLWTLDPSTASQQVEAVLLDDAGNPLGLPVRYNANLSMASLIAYDSKACNNLAKAGVKTVQEAIDTLCGLATLQEPGIHITGVNLQSGPALHNDTSISVVAFQQGIAVVCDQTVDPGSLIGKPTVFVSLDLPFPFAQGDIPVVGTQPVTLLGTVNVDGTHIGWVPAANTRAWLQNTLFQTMTQFKRGDRVLAHLRLKGNFIWNPDKPSLYLDGEAFGIRQPGQTTTDLDLRTGSGDGKRGGDFEMWFWIVPVTVKLDSLSFNRTTTAFGDVVTGAVKLNTPTLTDAPITLASSDTKIATVQPTVTIPANQSQTTFPVQIVGTGTVTISASFEGVQQPVNLTSQPPTLVSLAFDRTQVQYSDVVTGTLTLSGAAPPNTSVNVTSSNPAVAVSPGAITFATGQSTATFSVKLIAVGSTTISATLGQGQPQQIALTASAPTLAHLDFDNLAPNPGTQITGTVTLSGPAPADTAVALVSSSAAATVQASVTVLKDQSSASFKVNVVSTGQFSITATLGSVQRTSTFSSTAALDSISVDTPTTRFNNTVNATIKLTGQATAATPVNLTSSDPNIAPVPTTVTVPQGQSSVVQSIRITGNGTVTLTATLGSVQKSTQLTSVAPVLASLSIPQNSAGVGSSVQGTVTLDGPTPGQASVALSSSDTGIATVPSPVAIPANGSSANFTVSLVGVGSSTITAAFGGVQRTASVTGTKVAKEGKDGKDGKDGQKDGQKDHKDGKEGKEGKEGGKDIHALAEKLREVIQSTGNVTAPEPLTPNPEPGGTPTNTTTPAVTGHAFIQAAERPPVGTDMLSDE